MAKDAKKKELMSKRYLNKNREHPDITKFLKMDEWMIDGGADISKIELRYHKEDDRGVHAVCDIKKGETILFVPKH